MVIFGEFLQVLMETEDFRDIFVGQPMKKFIIKYIGGVVPGFEELVAGGRLKTDPGYDGDHGNKHPVQP